jgi:anaerobic dimethyl sulfoxide reductase subunit B (iron-sulfur subunit)
MEPAMTKREPQHRYAFYFDSQACSGCKACQVACKDKHNLPLGVLWRRVYEVSGGDWLRVGQSWQQTVFAYNLSIACNHCQHPICVGVCPTGAMYQRPDGIVLIDAGRCLGCQYCSWVCPYSAPQYDPETGVMTKCDFCLDELEQGRPPACVSACPMRALDFGELGDLQARYTGVRAVSPLPDPELTQPSILIRPHPAARPAGSGEAAIGNPEEVYPGGNPP